MNTYITSLPVNLFNGIFNTTIEFQNGFNILSGVNGTGKTEVLKLLKSASPVPPVLSNTEKKIGDLVVFAVSPKRNTDRKTIDSIVQEYKTQNKSPESFLNTIKNYQFGDGFDNYPPFAELFVQEYETLMQDGETPYNSAIEKTVIDFNSVLQKTFHEYEIEAVWIPGEGRTGGKLDLKVKKYGSTPIKIENLSTGEREILALIFNTYASRRSTDIYLIDEPEIHLNWDLEKGLFSFFDWFADTYNKQLIVVTHSRVIFKPEFYKKTQFLLWESGKIVCKNEISDQQKFSIAGETTEVIQSIQPTGAIAFVEDKKHALVLENILSSLNKDTTVVQCGNKEAVKSIYKLSQVSQSWTDSIFLVDGDNQGSSIEDSSYVHLSKYCIENYIFNVSILAEVLQVTEDEIQKSVVECLSTIPTNNRDLVFKKLADKSQDALFEVLDTFDCSKIIECFAGKYEKTAENLIVEFITYLKDNSRIDEVFGEITTKL